MLRLLSTPRLLLAPALLAAVLLSACEASRRTRETANPDDGTATSEPTRRSERIDRKEQKETADLRIMDSPNRLVAAVVESKVQYKVPREILMQQFNRQFDDGTVVDKALVRPIQSKAKTKEKPVYYLVGMGLRNGMFRAMALPLELSTDNELYLSTTAERYMLEGRGCQMCYFNFEGDKITGTVCEDNSGGGTCTLTVVDNNTFFPPKR
ncbi:hypothetical protein [Hymenobacter jeollabukensis]|uniref:Lipoprotein n=1 Tax=Hymenobacter jeollabukensis TaxID=2025313 RepID=A0A5R8WN60_9BACT|nr:hypothetical protein [Hymenobacter jeollabukensis]TLM91129.1 hypothetical protein FDY95_16160 [Hymenobacter jeollabukensis]